MSFPNEHFSNFFDYKRTKNQFSLSKSKISKTKTENLKCKSKF